MKDNLSLKHGLIIQSLSPLFVLLIIRHVHCDFYLLIKRFLDVARVDFAGAIHKMLSHYEFGEMLIVAVGIIWVILTVIYFFAFKGTNRAGFDSHGECIVNIEERNGDAAYFLMTFILPLLIDDLSMPQYWLSYTIMIAIVYSVLFHSNLYYQSPILALLKYKVLLFEVSNPDIQFGLSRDNKYVGITRESNISNGDAIIWKHIADNVFLIYKE